MKHWIPIIGLFFYKKETWDDGYARFIYHCMCIIIVICLIFT